MSLSFGDVLAILIAVIGTIASVVTSNRTARKYGDLAGQKAAIRYAEEKYAMARIVTLKVLLNVMDMARTFAKFNVNIEMKFDNSIEHVLIMPIVTVETAFLSKGSDLTPDDIDGSEKVINYLAEAHFVNQLIQRYLELSTQVGSDQMAQKRKVLSQIHSKSEEIVVIIDKLTGYLNAELAKAVNFTSQS